MQGEVEIIYQILGSDRQRMVSAAPHAQTSFAVTGIQTESLPLAVLRFRETGFRGQRKMRRNHLPTVTMPSLKNEPSHGSRQFGAFRTLSGNLR
jgi:hypothetical protein